MSIKRTLYIKLIRPIRLFFQRQQKGWDDSETWALDHTIAKFVMPRLKRFRDISIAVPYGLEEDEWNDILNQMITGFEIAADDTRWFNITDQEYKIWRNGFEKFCEYYEDLNW